MDKAKRFFKISLGTAGGIVIGNLFLACGALIDAPVLPLLIPAFLVAVISGYLITSNL
jgi:hypothetical protein